MASLKSLLVIGGSGNLGRAVVRNFKSSWRVANIDFKENSESSLNCVLKHHERPKDYLPTVYKQLSEFSNKYDTILCVAGGWMGGSIKDRDIFEQVEKMLNMNLLPSILAGHLASKFLQDDGLFILTGAAVPFRDPTPGMLAYGIAKNATHVVGLNLAQREDLPANSTVITILPEVIDTPENRKAMPTADHTKWSSPESIAGLLKMWSEGNNRPKNGSFAVLKNVEGSVVPEFV